MYGLAISISNKTIITYKLEKSEIHVGKGPLNDLLLPDNEISNYHFLLNNIGNRCTLIDKSGNGVTVNGSRISNVELNEGDVITLGSICARFININEEAFVAEKTEQKSGDYTAVLDRKKAGEKSGKFEGSLTIQGVEPKKYMLSEKAVTIGSSENNSIVLSDRFLSSFHCRIFKEEGKYFIADAGSTNGTFINGVRVQVSELPDGSRISLGKSELFFSLSETDDGSKKNFSGMISVSEKMKDIFRYIEKISTSDATVLITGETGTGKELVAKAVHRFSKRAGGPFIPINCAAIAKDVMESELFGHEKGAFTGALGLRKGAFEEADRGTLFLDEVGEIPMDIQTKLLRAVEYGEIKRVGANRPIHISTRIIAATNRNLPAEVKSGRFREDLYYRLGVIPVNLPPLRERPGDVSTIARHMVADLSGGRKKLDDEAIKRLETYSWPGNVRELKNVLTRAIVLSDSPIMGPDALEFIPAVLSDLIESGQAFSNGKTLAAIEKTAVLAELDRQGGDMGKTAEILGISQSSLGDKLRSWENSGK